MSVKVGSVYYYDDYFSRAGKCETVPITAPAHAEECDVIILWGGSDINTSIYGEKNTGKSDSPNRARDSMEVEVFREWVGKKPILGICRGAQLACAMLGGKLYQDVDNHNGSHSMVVHKPYRGLTGGRDRILTTSIHHQMMILPKESEIVAIAPGHSKYRWTPNAIETGPALDPEVAVDTEKKVLMIQGHPEYAEYDSDLTTFTKNALNYFFGVKI